MAGSDLALCSAMDQTIKIDWRANAEAEFCSSAENFRLSVSDNYDISTTTTSCGSLPILKKDVSRSLQQQ